MKQVTTFNVNPRRTCIKLLLLLFVGALPHGMYAQEAGEAINVKPPEMRSVYNWEMGVQQTVRPKTMPAQHSQNTPDAPLQFIWPMDGLPQQEHVMHNYVDLSGENMLRDYMGGIHTYDGHTGTDLSIRNFREMDRGIPVYAAADGVVSLSRNGFDDRNTEWSPELGPEWNGVSIFHNDSVATRYLHFRKNSVVVQEEEEVKAGDFLGYIGSSGFSTNPHLHFDVLLVDGENVTVRDPWEGTENPLASMWTDQLPYLGNETLSVYDTGIATRVSMGGQLQFIWNDFVEGLSEPAVFGMNEPEVIFWINAQTMPGDAYKVEMLRPDGSVYSNGTGSFSTKARFGYWYFYWFFEGYVTAADHGEWTARIYGEDSEGDLNVILGESTFRVGSETVWGPRFLPAGKSVQINGEVQQHELQMSEFTGDVTYELVDAPDFVSLNGNMVEFAAESSQPLRSLNFRVTATDENGFTDTFYYHVVDPAKPRNATSVNFTERVDAAGGQITDEESGITVTIPEGALAGDTGIEVGRFHVIPDGANTFGDMVLLGPSGLTFSEPVSITVPYNPARLPEGFKPADLTLLRYDQGNEEWYSLESEVNVSEQTVTGTTTEFSGFVAGELMGVSAEPERSEWPGQFSLHQNFPNPFNPSTVISYTLPEAAEVKLEVFNLLGQRVSLLTNRRMQAGRHTVTFQAGTLASGIYIYRIRAGEFTQTRKMLFVK